MERGLIVVRKTHIQTVETVVMPSWVAQYGIEPTGKEGEIIAKITPRFKNERWTLSRGVNEFSVLNLICLSTSGQRLCADDYAEVIFVMSETQSETTRLSIGWP
jgi:hypothetical protein